MKAKTLTACALAVLATVLVMAGGQRAEAFLASETTVSPSAFSCADVTEVPPIECEALTAVI